MVTAGSASRQERVAGRALARSALYQLLSQALSYPGEDAVAALRGSDLPLAQQAAVWLPEGVVPPLAELAGEMERLTAADLQVEHRRVLSHTIAIDCPPCETYYTARHLFQETQELSDIGGFFRAFGLELSERERLDHISVEMEFMHFLSYKEAHALTNHGPARARLCRETQRKFMRDHLGRWAQHFAKLLRRKAGGGYFAAVASLIEAFLSAEIAFLRTPPAADPVSPEWRTAGADGFSCPIGEGCP